MSRTPNSSPPRLPASAPLPRSLDPLDDESMSGYVLRLAHRLGVPPDRVIRRTGLAEIQDNTQALAKAVRSTVLPPAMAAEFATATRLTRAEVTALTLAGWAPYYPPIAYVLDPLRHGRRPPHMDGLFAASVRYCPACLAGDGTPVQNQHGGPWQRAWRLPVSFACLRHQRFLEHLCPDCQRPFIGRSSHLVALPSIGGLHPAQCRQRMPGFTRTPRTRENICPGRLDRVPPQPQDHPGPELLALQDKILSMLAPQRSAVTSSQYFTELQLVTALVIITWPKARPDTPTAATEAADRYIAENHGPGEKQYSNALPTDARASAAFLHAADNILTANDLRAAMLPLAPVENRTRTGIVPTRHQSWDHAFKRQRPSCSWRFLAVAETLVPTYRRTGPGGRRIPLSQVGYRPEHIPAFLPQDWADRHLGAFTGVSSLILRRNAATHLVRRARGGSLHDAAQFLGIKVGEHGVGFGTKLGKWARAQDNLHAFELALDAIAANLEASPRIDYQRRRHCLARWTLTPATWNHMVAQLQKQPGNRAITDDRKRLAVSAYIWARVTQGEYFFSPCPSHTATDPEALRLWKYHRRFTCTWLRQTDDHPHYRELKVLLDDHADRLAAVIDSKRSTRQVNRSSAK
ncbi:TniQ family protein [Kitasatospora sp. NPDC059327]|uniref:TniQ family protein n=1 Tax=Kitasatospora sp. NPDC059327 TaxID=3346803 RepID=UPI00368F9223